MSWKSPIRKNLRRGALALALLACAPAAWAQKAEAQAVGPSSDSILASIFRMLGALAIVFAIFFLGVWLFRNWQGLLRQRGVAPRLRVLEMKSLGARQALYVVAYERQRFLISTSSAGVALVTTLGESSEEIPQGPAGPTPFADALMKVLNRK